jgi:hypothetical protein
MHNKTAVDHLATVGVVVSRVRPAVARGAGVDVVGQT